jgi:hypothetical protein
LPVFRLILPSSQTSIDRNIKWDKPRSISYYYNFQDRNIDQKSFLYFKDATYSDEFQYLPLYFELIKVNSANVEVKILVTKTEQLSNEELNLIKNTQQDKLNTNLNYSVQYKRKQPYLAISYLPLQINSSGQIEKVTSFKVIINQKKLEPELNYNTLFKSESVLKSGTWYKIKLNSNGIYKITYSELVNMGLQILKVFRFMVTLLVFYLYRILNRLRMIYHKLLFILKREAMEFLTQVIIFCFMERVLISGDIIQ